MLGLGRYQWIPLESQRFWSDQVNLGQNFT